MITATKKQSGCDLEKNNFDIGVGALFGSVPPQYPLESEASVIYYGRPVQKLQNGRKHANQSGE